MSLKKNGDWIDKLQGSFHGVGVCELVGLVILYEIEDENICEKNKIVLIKDDGWMFLESKPGF